MGRWHLLSAFETFDSLDMFCRKAGFIRDKDEKYLYVLKDGVERGVEMKRDDWFRISISDGYAYEFRDGEWSDSSTFSTTTMPTRASIWIFGAFDEYTEARQKFEKAVQTFKDYFYVLNRNTDYIDRDLRELFVGVDDEDGVLERLRKAKKQLEEQTEDKSKIVNDVEKLVYDIKDIFDENREKDTLYTYWETQYVRFIQLYEADPEMMRGLAYAYERLQVIIDFSDEDYADWKKQ